MRFPLPLPFPFNPCDGGEKKRKRKVEGDVHTEVSWNPNRSMCVALHRYYVNAKRK